MCDLKFGDKFSDTISKAHFMKEKLDKLGFIKSKIFYPVNKTFKGTERQATDEDKVFEKHTIFLWPKYRRKF